MKHWTETDFQNWLYGLRDEDQHLTECAECQGEMERLKRERHRIAAQPEVSHEFLAAQRRRIYQRLEQPRRNTLALRWVLSAATLLLMILGITFQQLALHKNPSVMSDDEKLFR